MRAPVAPMGWPEATAPPLTLTFTGSSPSSRLIASDTDEKASLISNRSMSLMERPVSFNKDIEDRKSTRLNSSHLVISYAVFCLKKKKKDTRRPVRHHR